MTAVPTTDDLASRLLTATTGTLEMFSVYLGQRLGLYDVLRDREVTPKELADEAAIHPRYAREWLEQQAAAGFLAAEGDDAETRVFSLPEASRAVLADPDGDAYVAPFALMLAGIGEVLPRLVEAYRTGGGVPFEDYGDDLRAGQAAINRPMFLSEIGSTWVPAMPDVHERLSSGPARVADVGCGVGWSSIALAQAYPDVTVHGYDLDEASVREATEHAAAAGVSDRVQFSASTIDAARGPYDLAVVFEALHDMSRPVEVLSEIRSALAADAPLLVADEKVAEEFAAPAGEWERMMYGWSVLHCLPAAMVEQPSAATGTVMRPGRLRAYAAAAGFASTEILDVDNDFFYLYRLSA